MIEIINDTFKSAEIIVSGVDKQDVQWFREWLEDNIEEQNYKITGFGTSSIGFKMYKQEDINLLRLQIPRHIHIMMFETLNDSK